MRNYLVAMFLWALKKLINVKVTSIHSDYPTVEFKWRHDKRICMAKLLHSNTWQCTPGQHRQGLAKLIELSVGKNACDQTGIASTAVQLFLEEVVAVIRRQSNLMARERFTQIAKWVNLQKKQSEYLLFSEEEQELMLARKLTANHEPRGVGISHWTGIDNGIRLSLERFNCCNMYNTNAMVLASVYFGNRMRIAVAQVHKFHSNGHITMTGRIVCSSGNWEVRENMFSLVLTPTAIEWAIPIHEVTDLMNVPTTIANEEGISRTFLAQACKQATHAYQAKLASAGWFTPTRPTGL